MATPCQQNASLGTRLRDLRKARGWRQKQVADALGVTYQLISSLELNRKRPSLRVLLLLEKLFDTDLPKDDYDLDLHSGY